MNQINEYCVKKQTTYRLVDLMQEIMEKLNADKKDRMVTPGTKYQYL